MGASLIRAASELELCRVVAVADPAEDKAQALAAEYDVPYDLDARGLLGRGDVDAVIVASPNFTHCDLTCQAAEAGKHVFVEKPMALSTADCTRMIEACRGADVKLMVGQVLRYLPTFQALLDLVASGDYGEPFAIRTTRIGGGWGGQHRAPWRLRREQCGGPLYEINQHELDFMRCVCGDVESVSAAMGRYREEEIDYEDLAFVMLNFRAGGKGCLMAGHAAVLGSYDGMILCTRGAMTFKGWGEITHQIEGQEPVTFQPSAGDYEPGVRREVREFLEAVRDDCAPPIPGEEGRKNVAIAEAAHQASVEQRAVPVAF
jgi:predicted dehydrogenase